ncbi:transposase IS4 [Nitzschia inconspicua]|uniref:Transposase IS4 n=1 Tax=Nitzschia inconspicua TaxID=303405 RepID=A0A9K3L194_9STRA|nr:transposase IS4 [Nitzschia inconspicua]
MSLLCEEDDVSGDFDDGEEMLLQDEPIDEEEMEEEEPLNVGVVGTARNRLNYPEKEMKAIVEKRFNCLHVMQHRKNFLSARWVDNNIVNMVSTIHTGMETVAKMINDYNHWMLGVDKADQSISYYRPNLRCLRTWFPIFLHCLDIMRVNAYIIAKSRCESLEHKQFVEQYIIALDNRAAIADHYAATRSAVMAITSPPCATNRRRRMGTKRPSLPEVDSKGKDRIIKSW